MTYYMIKWHLHRHFDHSLLLVGQMLPTPSMYFVSVLFNTPQHPPLTQILVDYVCPFRLLSSFQPLASADLFHLVISRKLSVVVDTIVKPLIAAGGKYEGKIKIIFRNQVQPWHGSSTFTHEAGLAVDTLELISRHWLINKRTGGPCCAREILDLFFNGKTNDGLPCVHSDEP